MFLYEYNSGKTGTKYKMSHYLLFMLRIHFIITWCLCRFTSLNINIDGKLIKILCSCIKAETFCYILYYEASKQYYAESC